MKNKKPPFEITEKIISEIAEICELICKYLKKHDFITNSDVRELLGVSSATATRVLAEAARNVLIEKVRIGSSWGYRKV